MSIPRLIQASDQRCVGRDPRELADRMNKGELTRVRRGVYVKSADWLALGPKEQYGLRAAAFQQLSARRPVFCHASAALLWGLWIVGVPQQLHAITASTGGGRSRNGVTRHIGSPVDGVVECGPFLVTDKLTTTLQLINALAFPYAVAVCDSSLRKPRKHSHRNHFAAVHGAVGASAGERADGTRVVGYCEPPSWNNGVQQGPPLQLAELRTAAQALPARAARDRALAVIEFSNALSGSAGESLSRARMHQLGFPAPQLQRNFPLRDGSSAYVDFWFEEQGVAGEFDGLEKYLRGDWGSGLSLQERILAEKQREDQIRVQTSGFVRWIWREMMDREQFQRLLRQAGLPQK